MRTNPYVWLAGCLLGAAFLVTMEATRGFSLFDAGAWAILAYAALTRVVLPLWSR